MSKTVKINARPKNLPDLDQWVETREPTDAKNKPTVKPKRLTIDIDPDLHRQLCQAYCAALAHSSPWL